MIVPNQFFKYCTQLYSQKRILEDLERTYERSEPTCEITVFDLVRCQEEKHIVFICTGV